MKNAAYVLFLMSLFYQPVYAIKTGSLEDESLAWERGRKATSVCSINLYWGEDENGKPYYLSGGTGALIEDNIVVTCGHLMPPYNLPKPMKKKLKAQLKSGSPVPCTGFITFETDVTDFLAHANSKSNGEGLWSKVFEIESMMIHPNYDLSDTDVDTDVGFVKLVNPIKDIKPLSLCREGVFTPRPHNEGSPEVADTAIEANFTGYGLDIYWQYNIKRTVAQIGFIEVDKESSRSSADLSSSESSSNLDSEGAGLTISTYIPRRMSDPSPLAIIQESRRPFYEALCGLSQSGLPHREEIPYRMLYSGDSGGPLTIERGGVEYVIGVHSSAGFRKATDKTLAKRGVREFNDVEVLSPLYRGDFCALFTLEGGLRPELNEMLNQLRAFKGSQSSRLKECVGDSVESSKELIQIDRIIHIGKAYLKDLRVLLECSSCEEAARIRDELILKYAFVYKELNRFAIPKGDHDGLESGDLDLFKRQVREIIEPTSSEMELFFNARTENLCLD